MSGNGSEPPDDGVLDQQYEAVEITADDVDFSDGEAAIVGAAREQIQRQQAAEEEEEQR